MIEQSGTREKQQWLVDAAHPATRAASQDKAGYQAQESSLGRTTGLEPATSKTTTWRSAN